MLRAIFPNEAQLKICIVHTFTVRRRVTRMDLASTRPLLGRFTGLISLGLWSGVGWGGRWIGFSS